MLTKEQLIDALAKKADQELRGLLELWLSEDGLIEEVLEEGKQTIAVQVNYLTYEGGEMSDGSFTVEVDPKEYSCGP